MSKTSNTELATTLLRHIKKGNDDGVRSTLLKKFGDLNTTTRRDSIAAISHPDNQQPLLFFAVRSGADTIVKTLIEEFGLNPDTCNGGGAVAVAKPASGTHFTPPLLEAVRLDDDVLVRTLIDCGATLTITDSRTQHNVFHVLALSGSAALFDFFLNDVSERIFSRNSSSSSTSSKIACLLAKDVNGDTPLHLAATQAPEMLHSAVQFVVKWAVEEAKQIGSKQKNNDNGDDDEEGQHAAALAKELQQVQKVREAFADVLGRTGALYALLEHSSDINSPRLVETVSIAVNDLGVDPTARIVLGGGGDSAANEDDEEEATEKESFTTLLHFALEIAPQANNAAAGTNDATALLRALLKPGIPNNSNKQFQKKQEQENRQALRSASLRVLRWMHRQVRDSDDVSILEVAIERGIGREAMQVLLSCVTTARFGFGGRAGAEEEDDATKNNSDGDDDSKLIRQVEELLKHSVSTLPDLDEIDTIAQAEARIAARQSTVQAFLQNGVVDSDFVLKLDKDGKEAIAAFAKDLQDIKQRIKEQQEQEAAAATTTSGAAAGGDYSGTSSEDVAAARAKAAALKQAHARKAAQERRKEKSAEKAGANDDDEDGGDAGNDDEHQNKDGSTAATAAASSSKKKLVGKKKSKKNNSAERSVDEVDDDEVDGAEETSAAKGGRKRDDDKDDGEEDQQIVAQPHDPMLDHSFSTRLIQVMFVVAFIILFFFLSG